MKLTVILALLVVLGVSVDAARKISFKNNCPQKLWISPLTNDDGAPPPEGILPLAHGATGVYNIPDAGWGGRFWPKSGCDGSGQNCEVGQSMAPCLKNGCDPPAETKVEFFFPPTSNTAAEVWYDISLVDGYSLPAEIVPSIIQGTCVTTHCAVSLDACPTGENNVGDLRVIKNGKTVQCLSPCKKWNYPSPFGLGKPENNEPGLWYCCPTPPVSSEQCRHNIVVNTKYVDLIHKSCPSAYSYAYDDEAGLHNCPVSTSFSVTFCP